MTKPTLLKEVPIYTTGGACEKPIAERLLLELNCGLLQHSPDLGISKIIEWLIKQPENNQELVTTEQAQKIAKEALAEFLKSKKLFTLEEVEQIAREAWAESMAEGSFCYRFEHWWAKFSGEGE